MFNKKRIIEILILVVVFIIIALIVPKNKKDEKSVEVNNNTNSNVLKKETEKEEKYETGDSGSYDENSSLKLFDFEIKDIPDEINKRLENPNEFYLKVKSFAYKKGLVEGSQASVKRYEINDNVLKVRFNLNDPDETRIIAIVDLINNKYDLYYYK